MIAATPHTYAPGTVVRVIGPFFTGQIRTVIADFRDRHLPGDFTLTASTIAPTSGAIAFPTAELCPVEESQPTPPPPPDPALTLARRVLAYGADLHHPDYRPFDAPASAATTAEALAICRAAAELPYPHPTSPSLTRMQEAITETADHDRNGDTANAIEGWRDAYHMAASALYASKEG